MVTDRYTDLLKQGFMKPVKTKKQVWKVCQECCESGTPRSCTHKKEQKYKFVIESGYLNGRYETIVKKPTKLKIEL